MGNDSFKSINNIEKILTPAATEFLKQLHERFDLRRKELLQLREMKQREWDRGKIPELPFQDFTAGTQAQEITRSGAGNTWKIATIPKEIINRQVEITGPVEKKMMINGLNSGAHVFMADFEDSLSPTWSNIIDGQINCQQAVRKTLKFCSDEGKEYRLKPQTAVMMVRPRGLHLIEKHLRFGDLPVSASLFDFGIYLFHNCHELIARNTRPYFYLPKLEDALEAKLWNDVFCYSQEYLAIPQGSIRVTVLIENILAAFQMKEILFTLRDHITALNAGRWDYIFSIIKKFRHSRQILPILPDRSEITMTVPFMRAYTQMLVRTCHAHGAQAIGGMSAFIPRRNDPKLNELAFEKVREDKCREANDGFDGTWVAHPDLVEVARNSFQQSGVAVKTLPGSDSEPQRALLAQNEGHVLLNFNIPFAKITREGVRQNISIGIQYLESWLRGQGAVAIFNLMEDAATAEISRSLLWQWIHCGAKLEDGTVINEQYYRTLKGEILAELSLLSNGDSIKNVSGAFEAAGRVLDQLVLNEHYCEFLTWVAQNYLAESKSEITVSQDQEVDMHKMNGQDQWAGQARWKGIKRNYSFQDVKRLSPSIAVEFTLAKHGSMKLFDMLSEQSYVSAMGAMTGAQAVQMVKAGLKSIYLSGWQVAADANLSGQTYPDQSLYPSNSAPVLVRRLNNALMRADQIERAENSRLVDWYVPILADAEAGFGGPLHAFELMKAMIEAGASAVHFEDQLAAEKKCGHLGGKVLIPTSQFLRILTGARLASDILGVPTLIVARTDALSASLLTSDIDDCDREFIKKGERTPEGYYRLYCGLEPSISRALQYAPYADLLWFETSRPDLKEAQKFAEAIHKVFPGKWLAYNCSPSFHWTKNLGPQAIQSFQEDLGRLGYKYQFITLAGWHSINLSAFELSRDFVQDGMPAYVKLQEQEFRSEQFGYTAVRHQREVGTAYFDQVMHVISTGESSTSAIIGSTESEQFDRTTDEAEKKEAA